MSPDSGLQLSTSRIARILRPLRAKCKSLSTVARSYTTSRTAFNSAQNLVQRLIFEDEDTYLALIPPPGKLTTLVKLDRPARDELPLSKAIYGIRDAYRNTIQVAFGMPSRKQIEQGANVPPEGRIRSLASACASVIGEQMEEAAQFSRQGDVADEDVEIFDEFYEAVPPHYRRFTVASHALSLVLEICPRNLTLLHLLLEVNTVYRLIPQCETLLHQILLVAVEPPTPITRPRIVHTGNAHFLTTLWDMCCVSDCNTSAPFSNSTFARILIDVIGQTPKQWLDEVWTCKAVRRVARRILSTDFVAFLHLVDTLWGHIAECRSGNNAVSSGNHEGGKHETPLQERLSKWLEATWRHILTSYQTHDIHLEDLQALAQLITRAKAFRIACPQGLEAKLHDHLLSLCMIVLSIPTCLLQCDFTRSVFLDYIRRTPSRPTTFSRPIAQISQPHCADSSATPSPPFPGFSATLPTIRHWATTLQDHGLFQHEASLWSAALSHLETFLSAEQADARQPTASSHEFEALRAELIDRVEKAERRSLGPRALMRGQRPVHTPTHGSEKAAEEWQWEEVFGCWVQKTPAPAHKPGVASKGLPKRTRGEDDGRPLSKRRYTVLGPREVYGTESALRLRLVKAAYQQHHKQQVSRGSSTHSSRTSRSVSPFSTPTKARKPSAILKLSEGVGSEADTGVGGKVRQVREGPTLRRATIGDLRSHTKHGSYGGRKSFSFQTLVADALRNRVVLHPGKASQTQQPSLSASSARTQVITATESSYSDYDEDLPGASVHYPKSRKTEELSSDDALDLFACMSSGP